MNNKQYKQRHKEDCLRCCVAFYFKIPYERVPDFVKFKDWDDRLRRFFKRRGLEIDFYHYNPKMLKNKNKLYLVQGQSWRNEKWHHITIYKGKKPHFDPSHSNKFLKGKPKFILKVT